MPAYNASTRIEQTLITLTAQTYPFFEIIVVNDASTDDTEQVARTFLSRHNCNFQIITHDVNRGVSAARNTGIRAAHGEYVCFVDADDRVDENFLSMLCEKAENENADMVLCGYKIFDETKNKCHHRYIKLRKELRSARDYLPEWLRGKIPSNIWSCIYRKKFIDDNNLLFHEGCHFGEDEEFLAKALCASQRTSFVNRLLYVYVIHSTQEDTFKPQRNNYDWLDNLLPPRLRAVRYILRHSCNEREKSYATGFYLSWAIVNLFTICARMKDTKRYNRNLRMLKHKKIREVLLSSSKFFLKSPELAFKALFLVCLPKIYYVVKSVL